MKLDAFLFLQRSDIAHYVQSAPALGDIPHVFIDPGLVEEAVKAGLDASRFSYRPLPVDGHFHARVTQEATTLASVIDQRLSAERRRLFGEGVFEGWDQAPLWLFLMRALMAKHLGTLADRSLPERAIGLFRPSKPQLHYFDSCLTADLFMGESERWRVIDHCDTVANWDDDHAAHCIDFARVAQLAAAGHALAVTHVPTCYEHHEHLVNEILRAFPANIDIPSAMWDIPVRRAPGMLARIDSIPRDHVSPQALAYRDAARRTVAELLAPLVPQRATLNQHADLLAQRCLVQAINYQGLLGALQGTRPHFVLSDHDTGSNGPLFSVAARLDAEITVLPHASYPAFPLPHALKVRAIERDGFRTATRTVLGERVPTDAVQLGKPATPVTRQRAAVVCLMLNTLHSQGLSHIDLAGLARFHQSLATLCTTHGARLIVRLKPNGAGVLMASSAFEVSAESLTHILKLPLTDVADASDLCINYGEPTTAGIEFLARGSLLLHSSEQRWPTDHWSAPSFIADGTVESRADAQALVHIAALLGDASLYRSQLDQQQRRHAQALRATDGRIFTTARA